MKTKERLNKLNQLINHAKTLMERETKGSPRYNQLEGRKTILEKWRNSLKESMSTFIVTSRGNHGTIVVIFQAKSKEAVEEMAEDHKHCWPGFIINELPENKGGVVYDSAKVYP